MHTSSGFITHIVNFLSLGVALYALTCLYQYFSKDNIIKDTVSCRYCGKDISQKVREPFPLVLYLVLSFALI
jgi:hypothetical protein